MTVDGGEKRAAGKTYRCVQGSEHQERRDGTNMDREREQQVGGCIRGGSQK